MYLLIHSVILSVLLSPWNNEAAVARCTGTFTLPVTASPAVVDNYSSPLIPERQNPEAHLRVWLTVDRSFDSNVLTTVPCNVLKKYSDRILITCTSKNLESIASIGGIRCCSVSRYIVPQLDSSRNQSMLNEVHGILPSDLPHPYTGKGVLAGIIDTEFDIWHPAFRDSAGMTRFIALWDQLDSTKTKKNRFGYGTIKTFQDLWKDSTLGMGLQSHGTHTASTMAGSQWSSGFAGAAPAAKIIAVKYSGTGEVADGLAWIFSQADSLKLPCVVNLSLGIAFGPHDGSSELDQIIDSISGPGKIIVGAIGNDGAKPSHFKCSLAAGDSSSTWIIPRIDSLAPDSFAAFSAIDVWGETGKHFKVSMYVMERPTGKYIKSNTTVSSSKSVNSHVDSILWTDSNNVKVPLLLQYSVERSNINNQKPHVTLYARTRNKDLLLGIQLTNSGNSSTIIHGWNGTHEAIVGFNLPGFMDGDTLYTVNEIGGTAKRSITVGGYISRVSIPTWTGTPIYFDWLKYGHAFYSSGCGPTVDGRNKPDVTAPAWSVVAAISSALPRSTKDVVLWPDTLTTIGRYGGHTGTSMSSPFVAGIVACMLEANPKLTPEEVNLILQETAYADQFTGTLTAPSYKWGHGKVNAYSALRKLLNIPVTVSPPGQASRRVPKIRCQNQILLITSPPSSISTVSLIALDGRTVLRTIHPSSTQIRLPEYLANGMYFARFFSAQYAPITIPFLKTN